MWLRNGSSVRILAVFLALSSLARTKANAEALYTVADLGQADPISNYLDHLDDADKAAFQAGSFDPSAHPAPSAPLSGYYSSPNPYGDSRDWWESAQPVTSNDSGLIVGSSVHNMVARNIFVYDPKTPAPAWQDSSAGSGTFHNLLGAPGSSIASVAGINNHGMIVGTMSVLTFPNGGVFPTPSLPLAFVAYAGGSATPLGDLGGNSPGDVHTSSASALNDQGVVVGSSAVGAWGTDHAFVAGPDGMRDLNDLIPPLPGVVLENAVGIDAKGRIVVFGKDASGATREYLLTPDPSATPVPEPSTLALFGLASLGFVVRRMRAGRARRG